MIILPLNVISSVFRCIDARRRAPQRQVCKLWDALICAIPVRSFSLLGRASDIPEQQVRLRSFLKQFGATLRHLILPLPIDDNDRAILVELAPNLRSAVIPGTGICKISDRFAFLESVTAFGLEKLPVDGDVTVVPPSGDDVQLMLKTSHAMLNIMFDLPSCVLLNLLKDHQWSARIGTVYLMCRDNYPCKVMKKVEEDCTHLRFARISMNSGELPSHPSGSHFASLRRLKLVPFAGKIDKEWVAGLIRIVGPQLNALYVACQLDETCFESLPRLRDLSMTRSSLLKGPVHLKLSMDLAKLGVEPSNMSDFVDFITSSGHKLRELRLNRSIGRGSKHERNETTELRWVKPRHLERLLVGVPSLEVLDIRGQPLLETEFLDIILSSGASLRFLALGNRNCTVESLCRFIAKRAAASHAGEAMRSLWIYYEQSTGPSFLDKSMLRQARVIEYRLPHHWLFKANLYEFFLDQLNM